MKKIYFYSLMFIFSLIIITGVNSASSSSCSLDATLVNQDPYPVTPGEYAKLLFQINGLENPSCDGANVKLLLNYPFSLDSSNNGTESISGQTFVQNRKTSWLIPYDVRVDKNAFEGDYQIELEYSPGKYFTGSYVSKLFNVIVKDLQTDFDLVVQESSGNDVSLAIANIGKNTANSLIVRIPDQEEFKVSGTNGQIVGNLASGDYTIVGFNIASYTGKNGVQPLQVQIDYTDGIGERRTLIKEIDFSLNLGSAVTVPSGISNSPFQRSNFAERNQTQTTSNNFFKNLWFWLVILVILIGIFIRKHPKILKKLSKKISSSEKISEKEVPEWVVKGRKSNK